MTSIRSRADALAADAADPLASRRDKFVLPDGITYLVGHSLGPASRGALDRSREAAEREWTNGLVGSWNKAGWIDLGAKVGGRLARLIGADEGEVVVCDSVSVNLFKLAGAAMPLAARKLILVEDDEFPTDQYIAEGLAGLSGASFEKIEAGAAMAAIGKGGVLIKSLVNYRTGEIADVAAFEREARAQGAEIVWDLSHAAGIVPVSLARDGARLAAGCTYKYINGGPGAPAFIYASAEVSERMQNPLPGWLGHASPFAFTGDYQPAEGVQRFVAGTPPILSLSALDGALDLFDGVELSALHEKSGALGDLVLRAAATMADAGVATSSPRDWSVRGGHVSLRHENGYPIVQALMARGIQTDFREPDTIRFGLSPLFLSYVEVWDAMEALRQIVEDRLWDEPRFKTRAKVT